MNKKEKELLTFILEIFIETHIDSFYKTDSNGDSEIYKDEILLCKKLLIKMNYDNKRKSKIKNN